MKSEKSDIAYLPTESLLESIFIDAVDGMLITDVRGIIIGSNPAIKSIFGYEIEELHGQHFSILLPKFSSQPVSVEDIKVAARAGQPRIGKGFEVLGVKKNGDEIPAFLSLSKFTTSDKTFYSGIIHDLSDFKEAQNALLKERNLLQKYLFVTNSLIVELDQEGAILLFNQKTEETTGYSMEYALGKNWFDLILEPNLVDVFKRDWKEVFAGKRNLIEFFTHKIKTKKGETKIIKWHSIFNNDKKGNHTSVIASGIDVTQLLNTERKLKLLNGRLEKEVENRTNELVTVVNRLLNANNKLDVEITEREKAEKALRKSEAELRRSLEKEVELNQLKSRFLSMASHEFKTPISTILSSVNILQKYEGASISDRKLKHHKRIKKALNHMTYMLDDFFSISQFEEGKIRTIEHHIPLNDFIMTIIEEFQDNLKNGQSIVLQGLKEEFQFYTDENLLKNIILNLLSNASKYSKENKVIFIRLIDYEEQICFEIEDQGMGIPEEDQKYLFTRFFRAGNVEHIKGTGLGLNIVRDYVQILDGKITVKSEEGKGSVFQITFNKMPDHEKNFNH